MDTVAIRSETSFLFRKGYSGLQLLNKIQQEIVSGTFLPRERTSKIAVRLGKVEKCIFDGADEELQILNLLTCKE
jgi:replication factor C subunit 2/4